MKPTEDLQAAPAKQFASSLFHQAIGSLPVAIGLAIGATWLMYKILPQVVADTYTPQIWVACLGTGFISSAVSAVRLPERGLKLTDAKLEAAKAVAAPQIPTNPVMGIPITAPIDDLADFQMQGTTAPVDAQSEVDGEAG